jgi:hypothetical protein
MSSQASVAAFDHILSTFAHPFPGPDDAVVQATTLYCASLSLSRAIEYHGDFVRQKSPGLCDVLRAWMAHRRKPLWEPLLGRLREISATDLPEACYVSLIESGLRAHFDGVGGSWSFRLTSPAVFQVGSWILPEALGGQVDALSDGGIFLSLNVDNDSTYRIRFERTDDSSWSVMIPGLSTIVELPAISFLDTEAILLPSCAVARRLLPELLGARFFEPSELIEIRTRVRRAVDVIDRHSPNYVNWVGRAVACIAPFKFASPSSSSHPSFPGLIMMSSDPRPAAIAEMLVHEASHQYFFMATLLGPVDDGSDLRQYYSPLVGRARPIGKVLLSFHALGNMSLLFRSCIRSGIEDMAYCQERLSVITTQMQQVEDALRETAALTQVGIALWKSLAERLTATDTQIPSLPRRANSSA